MRLARCNLCWMAALLAASLLLCPALWAQVTTNAAVAGQADSGSALALASKLPTASSPIPPLPPTRSPISFFRELLAMDPPRREQALTNRPPEVRKMILDKIHEYESLSPGERELRLQVTELRWYLRPLMSIPATNRIAQLAMVPESHRELVAARLEEWDQLSPEMQRELLANEATIRYLTEIKGPPDGQRQQTLDQWSSMSEEQRRRILEHFRKFFELTVQEKQKLLGSLPALERGQIEKALRTFDNLPPEERDQCIQSFAKFAGLSPAERQQFLKSAERWKLMTPSQRAAWRAVVRTLPPPLPPGVSARLKGPPPLPPGVLPLPVSSRPMPPTPTVATNGN